MYTYVYMYPSNMAIFHVDMLNQQWVNLLIYVIDMELKHRHQNHQGRPRTSNYDFHQALGDGDQTKDKLF